MANQETALQSGHYSPVVNYSQSAKAPMPIQRSPDIKEDNTDWGHVASAAASAFGKVYSAYGEQKQQNAEVESNNAFAQRIQEIKMAERAGDISASTANTMMDAEVMKELQAGKDPKTTSKIYNDYAGGIPQIEEENQKFYNKQQLESTKATMDEMGKNNPWFKNLSYYDKISVYNTISDGVDQCQKLQQDLEGLDPRSPDYEANKAALLQKQTDTAMCQIVTTLGGDEFFGGEKDLNEISVEELKAKWIKYAANPNTFAMSVGEAQAVFDVVEERLGISNIVGNNARYRDITKKEVEDTNTILMKGIQNRAIVTAPEAFVMRAWAGNRVFEESLNKNPNLRTAISMVSNNIVKGRYGEAIDQIPEDFVPMVMRNTNDVVSNPESSKSSKTISARMGIGSLVKFSLPNISQSDDEIKIRLTNSRGGSSVLNIPVVKQYADNLGKSEDPKDKQDAKAIMDDVNKCTSAQCFFNAFQRPEWNYMSGMFKDGDISSQLRYDEKTGELFYTNNLTPEEAKTAKKLGVGWDMIKSQTMNLVGLGDGTIGQKLEYWNNSVAGNLKTVEEKIELWKDFEVRPASIGDTKVDMTTLIQGVNVKQNKLENTTLGTLARIGVASVSGKDLLKPEEQQTSNPNMQEAIDTAVTGGQDLTGSSAIGNAINQARADQLKDEGTETTNVVEQLKKGKISASASVETKIPLSNPHLQYSDIIFPDEIQMISEVIEEIESGGNQEAVNKKSGATGRMQLMPETYKYIAKKYNLPEDGITDSEYNKIAGTLYFQEQARKFKDLDKALAAYNWGPGYVEKAVKTYGDKWFEGARDKGIIWKDKRRYLPQETQDYLKKFYAMLNRSAW